MPVSTKVPAETLPIATLLILDQNGRPVSDAEQMNFLATIPRVINGTLVYPSNVDETKPKGQQQ